MRALRIIRNYFFYCGIEKEEYNAVKKDAYISNYSVWRILHCVMVVIFAFLYLSSLFNGLLESNRFFYMLALIYSVFACSLFFILKKDSLIAQLIIYLSISLLFIFSCLITQNKPEIPATTFIVFLLIAPMFMIDKPFFMTFELSAASAVFIVWMYKVKPHDIWEMDLINVVIFTLVGIVLNIIANSIRIKEFVLTRKLNIQKDTDYMTGLMNKGAVIREINSFLEDESTYQGIMMLMDVDHFKSINDTCGHDVGDDVIVQLGSLLGNMFGKDEIAGRFGGDEFIVFIRNTGDPETAARVAGNIVKGASESVKLPDSGKTVSVSIGIAIYKGYENDYSEIFKKADLALYKSKADPVNRFCFYE
ncbi:MAG: GGDEF domain-containing protein [Lachnospiraceae bacterium]|nr:GGDEF domain-containing protein [Lachnospiraceae bacterium]